MMLTGIFLPCPVFTLVTRRLRIRRSAHRLMLSISGSLAISRYEGFLGSETSSRSHHRPCGISNNSLGRQTRGIDTQRTDHTFQLFHCLVLQGGLERTEQRRHLVVGLQHLKDGLIALVKERKDMRHIGILSEPVGRSTSSLAELNTRPVGIILLVCLSCTFSAVSILPSLSKGSLPQLQKK